MDSKASVSKPLRSRQVLAGLLLACLISVSPAFAALVVIAPVMQDKLPLTLTAPDGKTAAPVVQIVRSGALYQRLQSEARTGFTATMLALDAEAQRISRKQVGPTWLYLSQEEGGFPRQGFWLREGKATRWMSEPFVDLVVDEDSISDGSFEEIFAHEIGHVFLHRLWPNLPPGFSRTGHHSFTITDQSTAFDEGFATHFQGLSRRFTRNSRLQAQDFGLEYKVYTPVWLSNLDRHYRIQGMRENLFAHAQIAMPGEDNAVERRDFSTLFDRRRLKNPLQMLSSEGFVATLFYRHAVAGKGDAASVTARYRPVFDALYALNAQPPSSAPLLVQFADRFLRTAPTPGRHFIKVIVEASHGALQSASLAEDAEKLAQIGYLGDGEAFVPALHALRKRLATAIDEAQRNPAVLALGVGQDLWLLIERGQGKDVEKLSVNLNTAETEHLALIPGLTPAQIEQTLASRQRDGAFRDMADFARRAGLNAAGLATLQQLADTAANNR